MSNDELNFRAVKDAQGRDIGHIIVGTSVTHGALVSIPNAREGFIELGRSLREFDNGGYSDVGRLIEQIFEGSDPNKAEPEKKPAKKVAKKATVKGAKKATES